MTQAVDDSGPALEVNGLAKHYGRRKALRECSFALPAGASLVVFGPNGAGKSTLLRLLAMLEKPTAGTFSALGFDAGRQADEIRAQTGLVSHAPMLYPDLTAAENLAFYARLYGVADPEARARELLEFVELSSRRDDPVRGFSRGMTQRVCLARALVNDPALVLLDEPYSGLDPHASRIVDALFEHTGARDAGLRPRTLVSVSHVLERGYAQATHVLLLARGKQVLFSPVVDLPFEDFRACYARELGQEALA